MVQEPQVALRRHDPSAIPVHQGAAPP
jgi:hypothetical protein